MKTKLEDLRKWFGKGKKGDWVRVGTDGEIKGDCAREPGEGKPKCMPRSKAHSMDKKDRASSARRKRRADPMADRPGTGNKPIMVKTDKKESVEMQEKTKWKMGDGRPRNGARIQNDRFWNLPKASLEYIRKDAHDAMKANPNGKKAGKYADEVNDAETVLAWRKKNGIKESVEEKNVPTNPSLWAKMKAQAKAKFDVYPSAYANGWAAKKYKAAGGGWKTESVKEMKSFFDIRESLDLTENYRTLARAGMGTESKGEARVGLELDYYDGAGTKRMGKITKVTPKGYIVKDDKDGKSRQFTFHDRAKAKEILARIGKGKYNESVEEAVGDTALAYQTPYGTVTATKRNTKGMRGKQDGYSLSLKTKSGKTVDLGSHPKPTKATVMSIAKNVMS